jgi:hypothetical protein
MNAATDAAGKVARCIGRFNLFGSDSPPLAA